MNTISTSAAIVIVLAGNAPEAVERPESPEQAVDSSGETTLLDLAGRLRNGKEARRRAWPPRKSITLYGDDKWFFNTDGKLTRLTVEDIFATDWEIV